MTRIAADGAPYANPRQPAQGRRRPPLRKRIHNQAANTQLAMGAAHPYGTPDTPMVMPLALVTTSASAGGEITSGVQDLVPLVTADGAVVPATGPGRWDQLKQAGRP